MSLILEALRKSEAERRRGEAPDLRVELPPPAPPRRRVAPLALAGGAAAGLLLAAIALWPGEDVAEGEPATGSRRSGVDAAATGHTAATGGEGVAGDTGGRGHAAPQASLPQAASLSNGTATFPGVERIEAPGAAPAPEPAPDVPLAPPPMATRAAEEAAADIADRGDRATANPEANATDPSPPSARSSLARTDASTRPETGIAGTAPAATAPVATMPASADAALRLSSLPASQRDRLPALKLSLHMWNEDPARRFAVIDGQRRIEGDRLGDAVIAAIDRDGVVLDLDGQRIRVPLP